MSTEEKANEELNDQQEDQLRDKNVAEQPEFIDNNSDSPDIEAIQKEANEKYLRLYSEFDNYKKRSARERSELIKTANAEVLKAILPVLDDFERAIKANEQSDDIKALKEGFVLISNKLNHLLQSQGLKKMEVKGEPLNTDLHEAITQVPAPEENLKGKIIDVVENGYYLNDAVIRYAKVVVGS